MLIDKDKRLTKSERNQVCRHRNWDQWRRYPDLSRQPMPRLDLVTRTDALVERDESRECNGARRGWLKTGRQWSFVHFSKGGRTNGACAPPMTQYFKHRRGSAV